MYIESKLKEVDEVLFSLDLSAVNAAKIHSKEIQVQTSCGVAVQGKIQFSRGMFTIDAHIENQKKLTDHFRILGEYIQISYLGKGESRLVGTGNNKVIDPGKIQYCYDCDTQAQIEMPAHRPTHYQAIFITKEYYLDLLKNEAWTAENSFFKMVKEAELLRIGRDNFPIDYRLYNLFNQITQSDWEEEKFKKYYLALKLKELFLCLHLCQQASSRTELGEIGRVPLEKIRMAHAYLIENFRNPPTIKELSRKVLLNELQLKRDFKKMYGKTIRSFVIELRMEKAKSLLGKYSVSEMAGILGYKSVPHFINTFKKYYGFTPKQCLKQ